MERTDGTNDLPWWLHAEYRWWHAGPPGLKRGDAIKPRSETGIMPLVESDPDMVYVTSDRAEAVVYATVAMGRFGKMPHLYEVSFAEEPIQDDTQPDSVTSFRVPSATIRRIEVPSRQQLRGAMVEIIEADEQEPVGVDPFDDDEPIEAVSCDLENPESCEACD